jgi:hypothetical protein
VDTRAVGALRALGLRCPFTGCPFSPRRCMSHPCGGLTTMLNPRQVLAFAPWQDVRFGSKADMCAAASHVRFTPNCDRESGHPQRPKHIDPPSANYPQVDIAPCSPYRIMPTRFKTWSVIQLKGVHCAQVASATHGICDGLCIACCFRSWGWAMGELGAD